MNMVQKSVTYVTGSHHIEDATKLKNTNQDKEDSIKIDRGQKQRTFYTSTKNLRSATGTC